MRALVLLFWAYALLVLATITVSTLAPSAAPLVGWIAFSIAALFSPLALPWLVVSAAFLWRLINCPQCHQRFTVVPMPTYVPRRCESCGFDLAEDRLS
jgi:hypothetical protein